MGSALCDRKRVFDKVRKGTQSITQGKSGGR